MAHDYRSVAVDTVQQARQRRLRTAAIGSVIAALVYAYKTNPSEQHYVDTLISHRQMMAQVPKVGVSLAE